MSEISKITLPNGKEYDLKDTTARNAANSAVPNTRTVNGKALSSNISLGAGDVGAYTKSETDTKINAAIASAYKYKGSVTADKLPTSGQVVGDVYNITNDSSYGKAGMNVAWTGTTWDALGSNVDLSNYVTTSDSRLSNARPASDVYAWAKAAEKPSYSASEISGLGSLATKNSLSADDVGAVSKSGDTMTGNLTAPSFQTGIGDANYFQCRKFRGEGDANTYYHAIDFGYQNHDQVDFYDYGGKYVFHKHIEAAKISGDTVIGEINSNGFVGKVNGHAINADVPAGAKFTDTTYSNATTSAAGLMSSADKKAVDREFFRMLPKGGTYIPANADLNSIEYLKVGNYYNSVDVESKTIKNIPVATAFMMYVLSPLSEVYDNEETSQWVYRLRIFVDCYGKNIFTQCVSIAGSFTYNPWIKLTNSNDLGAVSNTINTLATKQESSNHVIASKTQPSNQQAGDIWIIIK